MYILFLYKHTKTIIPVSKICKITDVNVWLWLLVRKSVTNCELTLFMSDLPASVIFSSLSVGEFDIVVGAPGVDPKNWGNSCWLSDQ